VTLDPRDWNELRREAHELVDRAIDQLRRSDQGRVWTPLPEEERRDLAADLPRQPLGLGKVAHRIARLMPYGVGNTHPRFFGWVHGAGNPGGLLAAIAEAAMNVNLGGREHGARHVERQVIDWCRTIIGFPPESDGLLVSGTSIATIIALKVARDSRLGYANRKLGNGSTELIAYTSTEAHACIIRSFDMLGLGSDALRRIPVDEDFRMNLVALRDQVATDRKNGLMPFCAIATAGTVGIGAIDDLSSTARICNEENLWFHVDGAIGVPVLLSRELSPRLAGIELADSIAFDFHKGLHVNYDAWCIFVRNGV